MSVKGQLDDLRASLPGCSLVVFGDLFSQITFCVSSQGKYPQEQLDALCVTAGHLLNGPAARSAARALGASEGGSLEQAAILNSADVQVFLRSPADDADVLCCVCSLDGDIEQIAAQARSALNRIAQVA